MANRPPRASVIARSDNDRHAVPDESPRAEPESAQNAMKTLYLLRHAKSGWDDPTLADHDRPLDLRGERAALVMGRYIVQRRFVPELLLCSTAKRAEDTLNLVLTQWQTQPAVEWDRALYLVGEHGLLKRLGKVVPTVRSVMIVGHNPDLRDLALLLVGRGDQRLRDEVDAKFPTAALATLKLPIDSWENIPRRCATLVSLATPKSLV